MSSSPAPFRPAPFRIAVADDVLHDLRARLRHTRWPEAELVDDWSQGVPIKWIQDVCRYWGESYDWRKREAQLNRFPRCGQPDALKPLEAASGRFSEIAPAHRKRFSSSSRGWIIASRPKRTPRSAKIRSAKCCRSPLGRC